MIGKDGEGFLGLYFSFSLKTLCGEDCSALAESGLFKWRDRLIERCVD